MVDLALLGSRARRASEWGRFRWALRAAWAVAPLTAAVVVAHAARECLCVGLVLLGVVTFLRWRNAESGRAAGVGIQFGLIPMLAAVITIRLGQSFAVGAFDPCGPLCLVAGVGAGLGGTWHLLRRQPTGGHGSWLGAALVTSLTAALGCVPMGVGGTLVVVAAIAAGSVSAAILTRIRAA